MNFLNLLLRKKNTLKNVCYHLKDVKLKYSIYLLAYLNNLQNNLQFRYISFISDLSEKFVELTHWTYYAN